MSASPELSPSTFVLLSLLAEGPAHGYRIRELLHTRGFRFWVDMGRSSIYALLGKLEKAGLVSVRLESGGGPPRKVFALTDAGQQSWTDAATHFLSRPAHPRNELDLGIYALRTLPADQADAALDEALMFLRQRAAFLTERLGWCRERELWLPALAFERPLLELQTEIAWLERVREELQRSPGRASERGWEHYEYLEPPNVDDA